MVTDSRYRFSDFWIGGDFNLPDMNWSSLTVTSNQYSYAMADTYLDILRNCNVEQIVDFSTRGNKTLDIFLTSNPGLIDRCKPLMVENGVAVNLLIYAVTSVLNSVILALSHRCIVLLVGLVRLGLMRVSISTASWSPTPGIGLHSTR
jgi:hypothetical protein